MTQLDLAPSTLSSLATRRINAFRDQFGNAHLHLAYHAALPLALTPDLMYRLWANFQQDVHGEMLNVPWVAVADLLLSSLCEEVGHELYEMNRDVRVTLLSQLKQDRRFGQLRFRELSDFLLTYVQQQLNSPDIDIRDRAEAQRWTAIAYTQPHEAAQELSQALSTTYKSDKIECLRIAAIVEALAEPLADFEPLLTDARTKATTVRSGVAVPVLPPPRFRKTLYLVIGMTAAAILAGFAYRYVSTPKPSPTLSPYSSPLPSPERSPATALPAPSSPVTTPTTTTSPTVSTPLEPPLPNRSSSPSSAPLGSAQQTPAVPWSSPTPTPNAPSTTPTSPPIASPSLPLEPSPSTPPPIASPILPSEPSSDAQCLTFKCIDVPDPSTNRGGAAR